MGQLLRIWIKRNKRGPMDPRDSVQANVSRGLEGSADQGGRRQVTLLSRELWSRACSELGIDVPPETRRANLYLQGVDLIGCRGKTIRIGDVRIRIYGETRPCHRMDEACRGLEAALDPAWYAGAFGEIMLGGELEVGQIAEWIEPEDE